MYFVKYGDSYLHDPRSNDLMLLDLNLEFGEDSCGFCDFTIYPNHPLYGNIKAHDFKNIIRVYDNDFLLFAGYIYELGKEFYLDGHVKCKGELSYLNMSIVRPYTRKFLNISSCLSWFVDTHNSQVDDERKFSIGKIQDKNIVLECRNDSYSTVLNEINSNLIENTKTKGYLSIRYEGNKKFIDYELEHNTKNSQTIDFGVNLTSYTSTEDFEELATYVIPIGNRIEETNTGENTGTNTGESTITDTAVDKYLDIQGLPNGPINTDIYKFNDCLYSKSAVEKYGWIGKTYSNSEVDNVGVLLKEGLEILNEYSKPNITIEIKAIDMHSMNPTMKPIRIGEWVRVRSKPHDVDDYFLCKTISLDLNSPENSEYVFGKAVNSFTSTYKKEVKDAAKDAAKDATEEYMDDYLGGDEDEGLGPDSQTTLKQIKVTCGTSGGISNVTFVYETVTTKPDDTETGDGTGSGESGGSIDEGETGGNENPGEVTEEVTISEEPYDCTFDNMGRLIKFGEIEILWY